MIIRLLSGNSSELIFITISDWMKKPENMLSNISLAYRINHESDYPGKSLRSIGTEGVN
jgi:hypothetical protein